MRKERNEFFKIKGAGSIQPAWKTGGCYYKNKWDSGGKNIGRNSWNWRSYNTEKLLIDFGTTVIALKIMQTMRNIAKVFPIRNPI